MSDYEDEAREAFADLDNAIKRAQAVQGIVNSLHAGPKTSLEEIRTFVEKRMVAAAADLSRIGKEPSEYSRLRGEWDACGDILAFIDGKLR